MNKYNLSTNDENIKSINKDIFINLMQLGFSVKNAGTFYFIELLLIGYENPDMYLSYSQSLNILCNQYHKDKNVSTLKSLISNVFIGLNKEKFLKSFIDIFGYSVDYKAITPMNLYESFAMFLQLK